MFVKGKWQLLRAFVLTFPHVVPITAITACSAVFVLTSYLSSNEKQSDIDIAGLQRMLSQEALVSILLSRLTTNQIEATRPPEDIFTSLVSAQNSLQTKYQISGKEELMQCITEYQTGGTSVALFHACNGFRDVADHNVKEVVRDAEHSVASYIVIILVLCAAEVTVVGCLMYLASRNKWVDRQEQSELELAQRLNSAETAGHRSTMSSLSHDLKGASVNCSVNLEVLIQFLTQQPHPDIAVQEMVMTILDQVVANARHVQNSIQAVRLLADLHQGVTPCSDGLRASFSLKNTIRDLSLRYPQLDAPQDIPEMFLGEEAAIYHVECSQAWWPLPHLPHCHRE